MAPRSWSLARLLRVLVACVALGMVCQAPARAMACSDVAAWIAGSQVGVPGGHSETESGNQERKAELLVARIAAERGPIHAAPAGSRAIIARPRLYLLHSMLLR